jgi:hypothetical protein
MHLGKTGRCHASFVDDALGNCPCSGGSRVCVIGRGLQAAVGAWIRMTKGLIQMEEIPCPAIQSVLGSIELICRFNST